MQPDGGVDAFACADGLEPHCVMTLPVGGRASRSGERRALGRRVSFPFRRISCAALMEGEKSLGMNYNEVE
jgi:hypothetical protein